MRSAPNRRIRTHIARADHRAPARQPKAPNEAYAPHLIPGSGMGAACVVACQALVVGWWPEDQWQRMWRGDGCSMCADAGLPRNEFSDLIAETTTSFVRLSRNQTQAGYSVVIAKRHVPELHHLTPDEREGFWSDVSAVGEAISTLFRPVKLAQLAMGFGCLTSIATCIRSSSTTIRCGSSIRSTGPFVSTRRTGMSGCVSFAASSWQLVRRGVIPLVYRLRNRHHCHGENEPDAVPAVGGGPPRVESVADRLLDEVESSAEVFRCCDVAHQFCDRSPEFDLDVLVDGADVIEEATHVRVRGLGSSGHDELRLPTG